MDAQTPWRAGAAASRLSYRNATVALCAINVLAVALLLRNHFSSWPRLAGGHRFDSGNVGLFAANPNTEKMRPFYFPAPNPGYTGSTLTTLKVLFDGAQLRYIWESEELRRAMEPVDLIKRVKEIEQEAYGEHGMSTQEDAKQTAAVDLSKRLKDLRQGNDGSSPKALEEWRKRKMERARQRAIDKDGIMPGARTQ